MQMLTVDKQVIAGRIQRKRNVGSMDHTLGIQKAQIGKSLGGGGGKGRAIRQSQLYSQMLLSNT
jgi:hypothetical protein